MRVFFDTNVLIDLIAARPGFSDAAERALCRATMPGSMALASALSICDIVYILRKSLSRDVVLQKLKILREVLSIVDIAGADVMAALDLDMPDYEDAVQYLSAKRAQADFIVTRDSSGFSKSDITIMSPQEYAA